MMPPSTSSHRRFASPSALFTSSSFPPFPTSLSASSPAPLLAEPIPKATFGRRSFSEGDPQKKTGEPDCGPPISEPFSITTTTALHLLLIGGLRSISQVRFNDLDALRKSLLRIFRRNCARYDNILPLLPISRRRDTVIGRQLQRIHYPQHF